MWKRKGKPIWIRGGGLKKEEEEIRFCGRRRGSEAKPDLVFAVTLNDHQPVCTYHGLYWYLLALGILHAVPKEKLSWGVFPIGTSSVDFRGKGKKKK
ncbi:hypothetical protein BDV40DRAFT_218419 [Aspergillus tamarii]|uniref:Uncharacterized protein n=1 Tax=Aspergillus tamarii TaxID=41984 RepID=A0A5N6UQC7_ASPTM|nr:hypothetical protein BDV40DRAFT_218419 [Aspergillus tamarii]